MKTQIINILNRKAITPVSQDDSSSNNFEGFENACEAVEKERISVPPENSVMRKITQSRSKVPRLESTQRTEEELEIQDLQYKEEANQEFMNHLRESDSSEVKTSAVI